MKHRKLVTLVVAVAVTASLLVIGCAPKAPEAEVFPSRAIEVIVPYTAGGGTDRLSRAVASTWGIYSDVPLRVIDMPGGGSVEGHRFAANAEPTGYVLLSTGGDLITAPLFRDDVGYSLESYYHLCGCCAYAFFVTVPKDSPFNTVPELIDYVEEHPNELTYCTAGTGSDFHVVTELFAKLAGGLEMKHVPLEGGAEQVASLMGAHTDLAFLTYGTGLPAISAGELKALAVTDTQRYPAVEVPTLTELGIDLEYLSVRAFFAPAGTPQERVDILEGIFKAISEDEGYQKLLKKIGEMPRFMSSKEVTERLYKDREVRRPVIEAIRAAMEK